MYSSYRSRVQHSHWSGSGEILSSDWLTPPHAHSDTVIDSVMVSMHLPNFLSDNVLAFLQCHDHDPTPTPHNRFFM